MTYRPDLMRSLDRLPIPDNLSLADALRAGRDSDILRQPLIDQPQDMLELLSAVLKGETELAQTAVRRLRLTEQDFRS